MKEGEVDAALRTQVGIIESLVRRHRRILQEARSQSPLIMERSLQAALMVFTKNGESEFPHPGWHLIKAWARRLINIYEGGLIKIALHISFEFVSKRLAQFRGKERVTDMESLPSCVVGNSVPTLKYLERIHARSSAFELECEKLVNSNEKTVDETADAFVKVMNGF